MKKKNIIILVLIAIIIIAICGFFYTQNSVKLGTTNFNLPQGYDCSYKGNNTIAITNAKDSISLKCYNDPDIKNKTDSYVKYNEEHNLTVSISKINLDGIPVYKSTMPTNSSIVHYWFVENGNTYEAYTWAATPNTDNLVKGLIKSAN